MARKKPETPPATVTRPQAARLVGTSEASLRRWEDLGQLAPIDVGPHGVRRYRTSDVVAAAKRKRESSEAGRRERLSASHSRDPLDGAVAARAFRSFEAGKSAIEVVCELELDPRVVRALHSEWLAMKGSFLITAEQIEAIARLPWLSGDFPIVSGDGLLENLRESAASLLCRQCRLSAASLCARCAGSRVNPPTANSRAPSTAARTSAARQVPIPVPGSSGREVTREELAGVEKILQSTGLCDAVAGPPARTQQQLVHEPTPDLGTRSDDELATSRTRGKGG